MSRLLLACFVVALGWGLPLFVVLFFSGSASAGSCSSSGAGVQVVAGQVPDRVATDRGAFDREQLVNAGAIMSAAADLGLSQAAQILGVQAAIGESGLRVLDRGDAAGPDSRGLFQQRSKGWGSYEDRMNPFISATNFFKALMRISGWEGLEPSKAINRVQRNADPGYYTKFRSAAVRVFEALAGVKVSGGGVCMAGQVIGEPTGKWVFPLASEASSVTSPYGPRGLDGFHYGVDISAPGAPEVLAPADLRITRAMPAIQDQWGAGENIAGTTLDGQYSIALFHMVSGSLKVAAGDVVAAGSVVGVMGSTGNSSGPHVHMEFYSPAKENPLPAQGTFDPVPVMTQMGAWR